MQELIDKVQELVAFELERANTIHPPKFNSMHEAYAVLLEEVQEAGYEVESCKYAIDLTWNRIKADADHEEIEDFLKRAEAYAINAAAEMIQTAAMARKARL